MGKIKLLGVTKNKENRFKPIAPTITKVSINIKTGIRKGATVKIKNGKAIKLKIDNNLIIYKDIPKIFPVAYPSFYTRENIKANTLGELIKENIIYIPRQMAANHNIQIIYREKMQEFYVDILLDNNNVKDIEKE